MTTTATVCLVILAATHLTALIFFAALLLQLRRSAQAVEVLAYRAQEQVERVGEATSKVKDLAGSLGSGWIRAAMIALSAAMAYWARGRRGETQS